MENNSILHLSHHWFRSNHSAYSAMPEIHDGWLVCASENETVGKVMLNLSAAFDVVNNGMQLQKLAVYGLMMLH